MNRNSAVFLALIAAFSTIAVRAPAQEPQRPQLHTNESFVEEVTRTTTLAVDDPMAVFAFVLASLPKQARVYPTENHYYFSFTHDGVRFAGNIKIDARLRDAGKVMFVYYEDRSASGGDAPPVEVVLDASRGVTVEKLGPLEYRLSYGASSVVFVLNDVSQVKPPPGALAPDEQFIGPVFDESAVRFFLVFNARLKLMLYVLDETAKPADAWAPAARNDRILVGKRTGFAFYRDHRLDRKILIGVFEGNVQANNFFDGPFDQIPDNFIQGDTFREAVLALEPDLKGKIDRYAALADGTRYAVVPYMFYRSSRELDVFHRCATSKRISSTQYYGCFVLVPGESRGEKARPLAMQWNRK